MFAFGELVEVLEAGTATDGYGNTVEDWDSPVVVDKDDYAGVEPRPLGEQEQDNRNAVVKGYTLYVKPDLTVTAQNRVRVRGDVWAIDGDPADWRNPFTGWHPGIVLQVGRVDG
jgi:head-tail adaptor